MDCTIGILQLSKGTTCSLDTTTLSRLTPGSIHCNGERFRLAVPQLPHRNPGLQDIRGEINTGTVFHMVRVDTTSSSGAKSAHLRDADIQYG